MEKTPRRPKMRLCDKDGKKQIYKSLIGQIKDLYADRREIKKNRNLLVRKYEDVQPYVDGPQQQNIKSNK